MVIWARAFRDEGDLGLNTYWNCLLRVLALAAFTVNVLPLPFWMICHRPLALNVLIKGVIS